MKQGAIQTPGDLLEQLQTLFPGFEEESKEGHASNSLSFHAVLMDFRPFYGRHVTDFSEKQLKALASIVNVATELSGPLANAFDTCFFERSSHEKPLRPFLSRKAKDLARGRR
jgi:hypothetical protein